MKNPSLVIDLTRRVVLQTGAYEDVKRDVALLFERTEKAPIKIWTPENVHIVNVGRYGDDEKATIVAHGLLTHSEWSDDSPMMRFIEADRAKNKTAAATLFDTLYEQYR